MDHFVYTIGRSAYVNLTNRCCNACRFCIRNEHNGINDFNLWLTREPSAEEVITRLQDVKQYDEVVFCGFGEPTYKIAELCAIAEYVHAQGVPVRVNTNGLGNLIHDRDITVDMEGKVDTISISLNASNPEEYQRVSCSSYGEAAFDAMLDFVKKSVAKKMHVILTVVDILPPEEIERCRELTQSLGAEFRVRELIE